MPGATAVALAITLATEIAIDDDMMSGSGHNDGDDHFQDVMGAMGSMDSHDMLEHIRAALGEDGYQGMLHHIAEHRDGDTAGDFQVDHMMHQMMGGIMQHEPMDGGSLMPPSSDRP